ncbi:Class I glutamine amidotransferase-like protein [Rhizoctonia solani]|uniref:Class I glutamine amidotransferase-like protein n=1 Tax=Rhizoctonia solani TaxID=456999 RepID=A0A8H7LMC9_9AGAM|nr:Class I glutamine amidotransferase-like protein [Rhizoctonia solani]KAF8684917.1 Class I glutamine amidotransferase-like protein [Rhizoctonia solani]
MEILEAASINSLGGQWLSSLPGLPKPKVKFEAEFLAESRDPIRGSSGPFIVATKTFEEVEGKQFDIVLVPAGPPVLDPESIPKGVAKFLRAQVPGAKYIFSVCGGSWTLASLGLLDGKRATSNKSAFNEIKVRLSLAVQWVPKARWVVDGKFWTSSGVTAGQDMAYEFLKTLAGEEFAVSTKNMVELRAAGQGDDEFAEVFKLT